MFNARKLEKFRAKVNAQIHKVMLDNQDELVDIVAKEMGDNEMICGMGATYFRNAKGKKLGKDFADSLGRMFFDDVFCQALDEHYIMGCLEKYHNKKTNLNNP